MGTFDFDGIAPEGRKPAPAGLDDSQWLEIYTARQRGYSWRQIFAVVGTYKNWETLDRVARRNFKRLGLS